MAGDAAIPSTPYCMTLFFSLLLAFHFAMAVPEQHSSFSSPLKDSAKKRNSMLSSASATAEEGRSTTQITPKQTHIAPDPKQGEHSRTPRTPMQWQNKIFNASEHEVPSGPNPISNR